MNYWVVYDLVRRRWKAKLKSSRPSHIQQDTEAVEQFPERSAAVLRKAVRVAPD